MSLEPFVDNQVIPDLGVQVKVEKARMGKTKQQQERPLFFLLAGKGSTYQNRLGCGRLGSSDLNPSNMVQDWRLFPGTHIVLD